jgi:hypothetical protein
VKRRELRAGRHCRAGDFGDGFVGRRRASCRGPSQRPARRQDVSQVARTPQGRP